MNRIKKNDPVAMTDTAKRHYHEGDFGKALGYLAKAAALGHVEAHFLLGDLYREGKGVAGDEKKAVYHYELAAIGGHPDARGFLAFHEKDNGRPDRAAKHYVIAANLGCDISVKMIKDLFVQGIVSKDDYAAALRAYQAAVNETKSTEREEAEAYSKRHLGKNSRRFFYHS
jgi:TPR repeat protein